MARKERAHRILSTIRCFLKMQDDEQGAEMERKAQLSQAFLIPYIHIRGQEQEYQ